MNLNRYCGNREAKKLAFSRRFRGSRRKGNRKVLELKPSVPWINRTSHWILRPEQQAQHPSFSSPDCRMCSAQMRMVQFFLLWAMNLLFWGEWASHLFRPGELIILRYSSKMAVPKPWNRLLWKVPGVMNLLHTQSHLFSPLPIIRLQSAEFRALLPFPCPTKLGRYTRHWHRGHNLHVTGLNHSYNSPIRRLPCTTLDHTYPLESQRFARIRGVIFVFFLLEHCLCSVVD